MNEKLADAPLFLLAAGGTGGHIFPAEALARALLARGVRVALVTDPRGGRFSESIDVPVYRIRARGTGGHLLSKLRAGMEMMIGTFQAQSLLRRLRPAMVIGFGGYPSVPTVYAAARLSIPILLHEQNAVLGRANRLLSGLAQTIALSFEQVSGRQQLPKEKIVLTGNPVRPAILALRDAPYPDVQPDGPVSILIMGGSQGARIFSQVLPKAMQLLPEALRRRLRIAQQCRAEDLETARTGYAAAAMDVELASFFHDVPQRLAAAHLVICRSGASTVAEVTAAGRPAVFVPYPHALADEQTANAEAVAIAGGGWLIPQAALTPEALAVRLEALLTHPALLIQTAAAARQCGRPDAADRLADVCLARTAVPMAAHAAGPKIKGVAA